MDFPLSEIYRLRDDAIESLRVQIYRNMPQTDFWT